MQKFILYREKDKIRLLKLQKAKEVRLVVKPHRQDTKRRKEEKSERFAKKTKLSPLYPTSSPALPRHFNHQHSTTPVALQITRAERKPRRNAIWPSLKLLFTPEGALLLTYIPVQKFSTTALLHKFHSHLGGGRKKSAQSFDILKKLFRRRNFNPFHRD